MESAEVPIIIMAPHIVSLHSAGRTQRQFYIPFIFPNPPFVILNSSHSRKILISSSFPGLLHQCTGVIITNVSGLTNIES